MPRRVAERAVERLAERDRRVLGRVMRAGLRVAAALEHEVEAAVERELLEEVVVEPGAGRDAHAALRRRAGAARGARSRRSRARGARCAPPARLAGERGEEQVVVLAVAHGDANRVVVDPRDAAAREQPRRRARAESSTGTKRKFVCDGSGA